MSESTRPQPSAEPVAVWNAAVAANIATPDEPYGTSADAAIAVIASALEAARREALEQAFDKVRSSNADLCRSPEGAFRTVLQVLRVLKETPDA